MISLSKCWLALGPLTVTAASPPPLSAKNLGVDMFMSLARELLRPGKVGPGLCLGRLDPKCPPALVHLWRLQDPVSGQLGPPQPVAGRPEHTRRPPRPPSRGLSPFTRTLALSSCRAGPSSKCPSFPCGRSPRRCPVGTLLWLLPRPRSLLVSSCSSLCPCPWSTQSRITAPFPRQPHVLLVPGGPAVSPADQHLPLASGPCSSCYAS